MYAFSTSFITRLSGSTMIALGLFWRLSNYGEHSNFFYLWPFAAVCLFVITSTIKIIIAKKITSPKRSTFWAHDFLPNFETILIFIGLASLSLFLRDTYIFLGYLIAIYSLFILYIHHLLSLHTYPHLKNVFTIITIIFTFACIINIVFQWTHFHYYILEPQKQIPNAIALRAIGVTLIWCFSFAVSGLWYWLMPKQTKNFLLYIWFCLVFGIIGLFFIDGFILYYSGLHISPVALEHMEGVNRSMTMTAIYFVLLPLIGVGIFLFWIMKKISRWHVEGVKKYYIAAYGITCLIALGGVLSISSLQYTPERILFRSFIKKETSGSTLPQNLRTKLQRFGIHYDYEKFKLINREDVYSDDIQYTPKEFQNKKPNIIIFFLESYSARLTSVYNPNLSGITPGLEKMAQDGNTTVFHGVYNATTPTAPGLLSLLCSFYPPTSHEEISRNVITGHRLLCLPEILKEHADYGHIAYITNGEKTYAQTDTMFQFMGVNDVIGSEELSKEINGTPLSWDYSDHQVEPFLFTYAENMAEDEQPFLLMWSTIDTHPPFNLAKDALQYRDGKNDLLNAFHTTDDAFLNFWKKFEKSPLYENTIVITIADHAVFPAELTKKTFPEIDQYNYFDELVFQMYIPHTTLPKKVERVSSGVDFTPTLLHILDINLPNTFEGYSIFDGRETYPNVLGMHDLGFYINEVDAAGKRSELFSTYSQLECDTLEDEKIIPDAPLTLCELQKFFLWKKEQFRLGRFWKPGV